MVSGRRRLVELLLFAFLATAAIILGVLIFVPSLFSAVAEVLGVIHIVIAIVLGTVNRRKKKHR